MRIFGCLIIIGGPSPTTKWGRLVGDVTSILSAIEQGDPSGAQEHAWTLEITDLVKDRLHGALYGWELIFNPTNRLPTQTANDLAMLLVE